MAFDVALGVSATVLSVVAIGLSLVFFFKTNDLFGKMNTTEARIEELARGTADKMAAVVDRAVDFWTRPTKEDQAAWQSELREIREEMTSLSEGGKVTAGLQKNLEAVTARLARIETDMALRGARGTSWEGTSMPSPATLRRLAARVAAMDAPSRQRAPSPEKPAESQ